MTHVHVLTVTEVTGKYQIGIKFMEQLSLQLSEELWDCTSDQVVLAIIISGQKLPSDSQSVIQSLRETDYLSLTEMFIQDLHFTA